MMSLNNLVVLKVLQVLEGLERSGRSVGAIPITPKSELVVPSYDQKKNEKSNDYYM